MLVEEELAKAAPGRDMALTIGVFDGVHLGHESLVKRLRERAAVAGLVSGVVTFQRHPRLVLSPKAKLTYVTSLWERTRLLEGLGVDRVVTLSFTPELSQLDARDFIELLRKHLRMRALVVGPDFALGHKREGNIDRLRSVGEELGFSVDVVQPMVSEGEVVSSTAIRTALSHGDMLKVSRFLGRNFTLVGEVAKGDQRGKTLGFPTANLVPDVEQALPPDGVYTTRAFVGEKAYPAVTNIGVRPTFGDGKRIVEVHLLDFEERDLYGEMLRAELVERLRGEVRFSGPGELVEQMKRDVDQARASLVS
jgi:riboflavin kinase/FMN adenylyltransferase